MSQDRVGTRERVGARERVSARGRVGGDPAWSVFELRQYTLHPGQRDTLVELFDRELVEPQEAAGMWVVGQFRDLDREDRFVWVRGFPDMTSRAAALAGFYGGPVWREHGDAANATMVDSDDVLLLRPAYAGSGFPVPQRRRPAAGAADRGPASLVTATLYYRETPVDAAFVQLFTDRVAPVLAAAGARPLACLETEPAENTFPALPVRTGEHGFVWFSSFAGLREYRAYAQRLDLSPSWREEVWPDLLARLSGPPQVLRLLPTARSLLR